MHIAAAMLSGKRIHIDTTVQKAFPNPQMLYDVLEAVGATAELVPANVDAFLLPNVLQPRKRVCCLMLRCQALFCSRRQAWCLALAPA